MLLEQREPLELLETQEQLEPQVPLDRLEPLEHRVTVISWVLGLFQRITMHLT